MSVNWTDFKSVEAYAKRLGATSPMIIFHNGKNYQITHAERRALIEAQGSVVCAVVEPRI